MSEQTGAQMISDERIRQQVNEGWTPEHDDEHENGELACVAGDLAKGQPGTWRLYFKHKNDRIRQLVIAGALIAAEIDRLQRAAEKAEAKS